ncbi:Bromodomain-containing protein [Thamnocephalis sphaerospora]|uniref:Bromodomain-containing protein n=1 Tax=Thamnocephalis sphaerospora TaxID=78915 RepID=A0A4P9XT62_9FUNG|nr:Bromodomain-containing protein [Thamnocephalis sphaerospora]|eukprot:RKP09182.1 Bromodomain-containing protein [Thamnocephalis sphaerospora]
MSDVPAHDTGDGASVAAATGAGSDAPVWGTLENLLLTQAVYHYGDDSWPTVSRTLRQHRLITRSEELTPKNCERQYLRLISELEEERYVGKPPAAELTQRLTHFHAQRVEELKRAIKDDEERIGTLVEEIHQIRTGKWDTRLLEQQHKYDSSDGTAVLPVEETTSGVPVLTTEEVERQKTWRKLVLMIWRDLANHRYASVFAQPIRRQQAPGYYDVINTTDEFHRDMMLIFQNAAMFNPAGSEFYQMALEMMDEVDRAINAFRQTEATSWQTSTHRRRKCSIMAAESPRLGST